MTKTASKTTAMLSDGDTLTVRTRSDLVSTALVVTSARIAGRGVTLVWIDGPMYLAFGERLTPIRHPEYSYAATPNDAARVALAFAVKGAEDTMKYARAEGIAVEDCY